MRHFFTFLFYMTVAAGVLMSAIYIQNKYFAHQSGELDVVLQNIQSVHEEVSGLKSDMSALRKGKQKKFVKKLDRESKEELMEDEKFLNQIIALKKRKMIEQIRNDIAKLKKESVVEKKDEIMQYAAQVPASGQEILPGKKVLKDERMEIMSAARIMTPIAINYSTQKVIMKTKQGMLKMRQGESISGYTIIKINENSIVVSNNSDMHELLYLNYDYPVVSQPAVPKSEKKKSKRGGE